MRNLVTIISIMCSLVLTGCTAALGGLKEVREEVVEQLHAQDQIERQLIKDSVYLTCQKPDIDVALELFWQDKESFLRWARFCQHEGLLEWIGPRNAQ